MRFLPYLVLLGSVIAALIWAGNRAAANRAAAKPRALPAADPFTADPFTAQAVVVHGPERGPGWLRLTPTQLVFTSGTGRVLVIERLDITGATLTRALPDRETAAAVLAVATDDDVFYFQLDRPEVWLHELR